MCGIAGVAGPGAGRESCVALQLGSLRHRGPDSEGAYERPDAVVGQTRLAVIDLVTGDPPITNEDRTIGVALNGEIYNYLDLRRELHRRGHQLKTECDTEVIAHLAEDHSPTGLAERLDGMFAFAVWDERNGQLVLGRDRLGKKPLYYWCANGRLVFGSEIKAVLADPAVPRRLNPAAISAYLTFGYVPTPHTFFEGVRSLPPGHVLTMRPGGTPLVERYWEPPVTGLSGVRQLEMPYDQAAAEVRRLLSAAVERRLLSDVPLGAFLSGGVDSSGVVALMAGLMGKPVSTFTIGFDDTEGFDERPYARQVARRFGTEHTEFVVKPDAAALIERLVWHHDQPFGDSSALPTFLLSELTRKHVTVALCGDGGDEVFAGYERFAAAMLRQRLEAVPAPVRSTLARASAALPRRWASRARSVQRLLESPRDDASRAYLSWISYVPLEWRDALLPRASDWAIDDYERVWRASEGAEVLDRLLDLNLRTYLLDDLLPKADRMSMAHGLELRSPFLDRELVEFALRLPRAFRIRGLSLKRVLKAALGDLLPPEIINRPKHGFGVPLDRWFRTDLRRYVRGTLGNPRARVRKHLLPEAVDRLLAEHEQGVGEHGHALWTLLTLEVFLDREDW